MLSVSEALDRAQMLCAAATKAGADAADALYYCNAATSVSMRLGALEDVERSEGQDISLRVFVGQRSASVSTADMDAAELAKLVERCVAMAREAPEDPYAGLAPADRLFTGPVPDFDLDDGSEADPQALREAALAVEEGRYGVRVNAVGPGMLTDGMAARLIGSGDLSEEALEITRRNIPLGTFGTADDIAEAVCFLASDRAGFISGQKLDVDGGYGA